MGKETKDFYEFGPFQLDASRRVLLRDQKAVPLLPKAFDTLLALVENSGRVLEKDELMKLLWPDSFVEEANLAQNISVLRKALGEQPSEHRYIVTVPGRGYRFAAPVRKLREPDADVVLEGHSRARVTIEEVEEEEHPGEQEDAGPAGTPPLAVQAEPRPMLPAAGQVRPRPARWKSFALAAGTLAALVALLIGLNVRDWRARLLGGSAGGRIQSVVVLPLENLSHDPEQEYFADGMTDELITNLAKISALRVISRTSAMRYKGTRKALPEIRRELQVDAVVEGTVVRSGNRVRITTQLIETATDRHLWAESYERELGDVLELQNEVAQAITRAIRVKLTPQEQAILAHAPPIKPEAYEAYLKGRYLWNRRTVDGLKKSIAYFQQAIEKEPSYARAYAGLADSYNILGNWGLLPPKEAYPKAKAAATKALEIDDTLAEAQIALAFARYLYDRDWSAEQGFRRAIELNPSYGPGHQWYGVCLVGQERFDEALAEAKRAEEAEPFSLIINAVAGWISFLAHRYDRAIEECRKTLEMDPNFYPAHVYMAMSYEAKGMYKEAILELEQANRNTPFDLGALGHAYAAAGRRAEALKVLDEMKQRAKKAYFPAFYIALVYAGLGEKDQAFQWLDKAYEERFPWLIHLKVDPRLDPLRAGPRFADLLRRVGLPP